MWEAWDLYNTFTYTPCTVSASGVTQQRLSAWARQRAAESGEHVLHAVHGSLIHAVSALQSICMVMLSLRVDFLTRHEAELSYFEKKSKPPTFSLHRFAQNRQMIIEILQTAHYTRLLLAWLLSFSEGRHMNLIRHLYWWNNARRTADSFSLLTAFRSLGLLRWFKEGATETLALCNSRAASFLLQIYFLSVVSSSPWIHTLWILGLKFPSPPRPPVLAHAFLPFFHSLYCSESGMACVFHHRNRHNTPAQPSLGSTNRPNKINHSVGVCKSLFSSLHSTSNRTRRVRARLRTFLTSFWCWSQTQFDIKQKQSHTSAPNISADGDFIFVFNMTCSDCPRPIHITCWDRTLLCLWRNLMIRRIKTRCYEINLFF